MVKMIRECKTKEDLDEAAKLAVLCFHEPPKDMEKFFSEIKEFTLLGAFEEENMVAAAGWYDFQIFIREQLLNCAGIAYVMTNPIYRRKGHVKELMNKILLERKAKGYSVSALWPFDYDFYRKFGFERFEKTITYKFKPSQLSSELKLEDNIKIVEVTKSKDYTPLIQVAKNAEGKWNRVIGETNAWQVRGELQNYSIYLLKRDDEPIAYICFEFKKRAEWQYDMRVMDLAFTDIDAKHAIFAFIRNFSADISNVIINLPYTVEVESYLTSVLEDCKFNQWPAMLRILDVKKSFESLKYPSYLKKKLLFNVEDSLISENTGTWQLHIENGQCIASKVDVEKDDDKVLKLTLHQLTQLLSGYSSLDKILEHKNSPIPDEWNDTHLFPEVPTAIMVWF